MLYRGYADNLCGRTMNYITYMTVWDVACKSLLYYISWLWRSME